MLKSLGDTDVVVNIVMLLSLIGGFILLMVGRTEEASMVATPGIIILVMRVLHL